MKNLLLMMFVILAKISIAQSYKNWDAKSIEGFYEKVSVKNGSLNEDGEKINYIFIPTTLRSGQYDATIVDYKNNLYEIKGTNNFIVFSSYVGYWGYSGKTGVLDIGSSSWSSKFYIKP